MRIKRGNLDEAFERFKDVLFAEDWECGDCGQMCKARHSSCFHADCRRDADLFGAAKILENEGMHAMALVLRGLLKLPHYKKLARVR